MVGVAWFQKGNRPVRADAIIAEKICVREAFVNVIIRLFIDEFPIEVCRWPVISLHPQAIGPDEQSVAVAAFDSQDLIDLLECGIEFA